jgi:ABC-2 type transport system permease protein
MAVYKRHYKPYAGTLTPSRTRFLIPARYALETLFQSRLLIGFLMACCIFPVIGAVTIYLRYNLPALELMRIDPSEIVPMNAEFFAIFLGVQGSFAFLLTAYAAPGLVAPDLSNNALPLYLSRPISRAEYILGKMAVLCIPLSCVTWIPGVLLWLIEAGLDQTGWGAKNLHLLTAVFVGSWLWILLLCLVGLAISAWVRWKVAASASLFGVFFVSSAFGAIVNEVMDTTYGSLLNMGQLVGRIWARMLHTGGRRSFIGEMFDLPTAGDVPLWAVLASLAAICGACVWMLEKKLRAKETVS